VRFKAQIRSSIQRILAFVWEPLLVLSIISFVWAGTVFFVKKSDLDIGQHSVENAKGPNIIVIMCDALTSKDMSLYGYHRKTTPELETT